MPLLDSPAVVAKSADSAPPASSSPAPSDNHIYFTGGVNADSVITLMKQVRDAENELRIARIRQRIPDNYPKLPIYIHVQSAGGDAFSGLSAGDQLSAVTWPTSSIIEGYACSAATFIALACKRRCILPNSYMLVHQLSSIAWGNYEQLKDDMRVNDMLMESIVDFYRQHSHLKKGEIKKLLKHDYWMGAHEAIEKGFVHDIWSG